MAELQKVLKVTQAQYDTLAAGGTVGSYTGLNSNYIYLIQDDTEYIPTITYAVDAVTRPTSSSDYVVYHITAPTITALTEGLTIRVTKGLSSLWPSDSSGAVKLLQINSLDPIAIFWRYNSFAAWNNFDNAVMTLTYSANARSSTSSYYGYTLQSGFILDFTYDSGNDTYNLYDYGGYHTGANALTAYSLVGWDALGNRVPVINADGTVGTSFDYSRGVQYWEAAVSANQNKGPWTGNAWYPRVTATILSSLISRYGLNTLTTQDRLYLKCNKNGRMLKPVGIVKSYPTSADGYYYMLFAKPYQEYTSSTGNQTWTIFINQPVYYYAPNVGVVSLDDSLTGAIATISAFISANPGSATATLNSIQIGSTNYAIPASPSAFIESASVSGNTLTLTDNNGNNTTYTPTIPAQASDVNDYGQKYVNPTQVRDYQTIFGIAPTLLTNINGHSLSSVYNTVDVTVGGYPAVKIRKNDGNANLTFDESHNYMRKITGSNFTPIFGDGTVPQYSYIVDGQGNLYKPQWDSTNGLLLYKVNRLAMYSDIPSKAKVWTNTNPTSDFAAQTITVSSLANYSYIVVLFKLAKTNDNYLYFKMPRITNYSGPFGMTDGVNTYFRNMKVVSNTRLQFLAATYNGATANNAMIPIEIWGTNSL